MLPHSEGIFDHRFFIGLLAREKVSPALQRWSSSPSWPGSAVAASHWSSLGFWRPHSVERVSPTSERWSSLGSWSGSAGAGMRWSSRANWRPHSKGAPGKMVMEFITRVAGRGGRSNLLEFTDDMATAFRIGEPGRPYLEFMSIMAGLGGRTAELEFRCTLATAFSISAPGNAFLEFIYTVAGRRGRNSWSSSLLWRPHSGKKRPAGGHWNSSGTWPGAAVAFRNRNSKICWRPQFIF
jgi:hypothetical protein